MTQTIFIARDRNELERVGMYTELPKRNAYGQWEGKYLGFIDNEILSRLNLPNITCDDEPIQASFEINLKNGNS